MSNVDHSKDNKISLPVVKCIERISRAEGFVSYNVNIHNIPPNGGNYSAILQAVDVKERTKLKDCEREINLFLKNRLSFNMNAVSFDEVYKREALFYNELVPIYNKLQETAKIPLNERFKVAKSYEESNSEVIILEDLSKRGYCSPDRREPMTLQFAELSVKEMAKFHALSFVLQDREPEYFNQTIKSLKTVFEPDSDWCTLLDNMCDAAVECLDRDSKYRLAKYKPNLKRNYKKVNETSQTIPTCLCHGDVRHSNMMIIEKNDDIEALIVTDFQMIHYGSPVMDFICLIFSGSDQKLRINHLEELKGVYYETFRSFLDYFDINAEHVYSKERFEKEYCDNLDFGLPTFMVAFPFIFSDEDVVPNIENVSKFNVNINYYSNACKERLRGVVADFIQWGYL